MNLPDQKCENCLCFKPHEATPDQSGTCHFLPPVRLEKGVSAFPPVPAFGWCRQWEPANVAEDATRNLVVKKSKFQLKPKATEPES